jgi:HK97 family phage portal protein
VTILASIRAYQRALLNARRRSALADRYPLVRETVHVYSGLADRLGQASDDYVGHAQTFKSYVWVRKAVTLIAQTLAPLPIRVVDSSGKALNGHPLVSLYANPNDTMPGPEFRGVSLIHLLLGGERVSEIVDDARGRPRELWPRRPDRVGIRPDESRKGYPRAAEYVLSDLATSSYDGTAPIEAVIFEKFANPLSDWRGLSPISVVREGVQIALLAQAQRKLFYKNNARVEYALTAAESLAPNERAWLEAQVNEKYGGGQGTGKPMILEFGQSIQTISYPPKDMTSLEDQGLTADEVAAIFGIPDILMGFGADTYDTQEKRDAAMSVLWALTLLPLVQQFDMTETHFWTNTRPMLRNGERIQTDLSSVAILQEDVLPKLEGAQRLFALGVPMKVINDRLKLGLGDFPGNMVGYLPMNLVPADELATPAAPAGDGAKSNTSTPNAPILGYHIESGVVSRNEARAARLGARG